MPTLICKWCKEGFDVYPSHVDRRVYCSEDCRIEAKSGPENSPLSNQENELRRRLYERGCSDREIGDYVGVSKTSIMLWRQQRELEANHPAPWSRTARERFEDMVTRDGDDGCWEWKGATTKNGYGNFGFEGQTHRAHRVSWRLFKGEIPDDLHVLHECDNPPCTNPGHLFLGTNEDNIRDSMQKGRMDEDVAKRLLGELRA